MSILINESETDRSSSSQLFLILTGGYKLLCTVVITRHYYVSWKTVELFKMLASREQLHSSVMEILPQFQY